MAATLEAKNKLNERGEKLNELGQKTDALRNEADDFLKLAKQLNQKSSRWW